MLVIVTWNITLMNVAHIFFETLELFICSLSCQITWRRQENASSGLISERSLLLGPFHPGVRALPGLSPSYPHHLWSPAGSFSAHSRPWTYAYYPLFWKYCWTQNYPLWSNLFITGAPWYSYIDKESISPVSAMLGEFDNSSADVTKVQPYMFITHNNITNTGHHA